MRLQDLSPIDLPEAFKAVVRVLAPGGPYGRAARRAFGARRTILTVASGEVLIDGGREHDRRSVPIDRLQFVRVWGAGRLPFQWGVVDVVTRDGGLIGLMVMGPRRLLAALRSLGLELFTNPAWPGVYAAALCLADVEWSTGDPYTP